MWLFDLDKLIKPKIFQIFPPFYVQDYSENYPPEFSRQENWPLGKFPPGKITPNEIPSPLINHTNERKNKIAKVFALKKAVQYNILIKITKVLFDAQMTSQKIRGLDTFFTEWMKIQKFAKSENRYVAFTCQLYKSRRTKGVVLKPLSI